MPCITRLAVKLIENTEGIGGATGTRTPDLLRAKQALSQLSYCPKKILCGGRRWTRTTDLDLIRIAL